MLDFQYHSRAIVQNIIVRTLACFIKLALDNFVVPIYSIKLPATTQWARLSSRQFFAVNLRLKFCAFSTNVKQA